MEKSIYLILHNIRSLYNIGSLFRTADAFGVKKIYLCGISAHPLGDHERSRMAHRQMDKIAKTALGAERTVPWEYHRQTSRLIKKLKKQHVKIVALEITKKSVPLSHFKAKFPLALALGNEIKGISKNILRWCNEIVSIPQSGTKESLNVAVAAAIALYAIRSK